MAASFQNFPEHQYPSIVGRPILRTEDQAGDIVVKDILCGDEAAAARSMLQISYPVFLPAYSISQNSWSMATSNRFGADKAGRWKTVSLKSGMICNTSGTTLSTKRCASTPQAARSS